MRLFFLIGFLLTGFFLNAQNSYPQDYFKNPLDVPLILSGTFGELRSNHFHSGMDIKTQQRIGLNVLASAEGYVSRIKISHYGYGKALYIQHPNGYTSVYGHLNKFSPKIEAYIKKRQYQEESYEIQVFPQTEDLQVKQDEVIAFSGNSGGSGGPHLHFEIRDSQQRPINPLHFGIEIKDTYTPIVKNILVYPEGETAHVNGIQKRQQLRLIPKGNGVYETESLKAHGKIGFGISTIDRLNYAANQNGVFKISSFLNGSQLFEADFSRFSFAESRYINRFIDYDYYKNKRNRVQKLFIEPNNPLSILKQFHHNGFITVKDSLDYIYTINVEDFKGNISTVKIPIKDQALTTAEIITEDIIKTDYFARANEAVAFDEGKFDVYIPKGALYDDVYFQLNTEGESITIGNDAIPLHKNISIGFDVSHYTEEDKKQLYIARMSDWGTPYYEDTYKKRNRFTVRTRTFGTYKLMSDTKPPRITPINFREGKWMSNYRFLKFKIADDETGISSYRATINGEFILMEYDYKTDSLVYDFNDNVVNITENNLKIIVVDNVGNSTTFEGTFFRKK
ncbi:M23 family metallopeptidase [Mesonia aquimarina]|uniref:M23 family metallopeptidase n=1 Tax=Mesonia aquimarina TaxID=1504967 RepID=UPI000EF5D529|nr:M23 family metallopeptidase [Mesonia aquimarina]